MNTKEIAKKLLGREQSFVFSKKAEKTYKNKAVLVTGGGGSIGSEICRLLVRCQPSCIVIFDMYENCAFELLDELCALPELSTKICIEIGSVQDAACLEAVFEKYSFDTVIHAAAHKHVPLMEECAAEAVKNNVFGTYNVCLTAEKYKAERFILISTDKAVNPVSVMGATKRLSEMIIKSFSDSKTVFSSVRFGNVLGSAGSALPLFLNRIERGDPLTLTDKNMTRYFMTPSEAAGLVLEAGAFSRPGEIYVLDMGEQVKMYDLCIRLRDLTKSDADICITGKRPGEKISEELFLTDLVKSENGKIYVEKEEPLQREAVEEKLLILREALNSGHNAYVKEALKKAVPEYSYG